MPTQYEQLLNIEDIRLERMIRAERSLCSFVKQAWHVTEPSTPYIHNWHIDAICEHLQAVSNNQISNLLINMPPRAMKSLCVSVFWPMWEWIEKPYTRWMFSSYALSLAIRDSIKCRRLIESDWYKGNWGHIFQLAKDQNLKSRFENDKSGYRLAVSVGSAATGEGGDRIVCDDPHNVNDAESEIIRQGTLDWWDQTMSSRLNNPKTGARVIVMQRVHQADLSGHILDQGNYVHLKLPAEFEPETKCFTSIGWSDPRKEEGELLWPERLPKTSLNSLKKMLGSVGFAGQYQQRPMPAEGGQFQKRWFRYFTTKLKYYELILPDEIKRILISDCWHFITVDLAISQKQTADYTVICVWAVTPENDLLLVDRLRERLDNPEQQKQISLIYRKHMPNFIKVENVAYQLALIQQLRKQGFPVTEFKPVKDKVSRASTASVYYESGKVYHPLNEIWLPEWEEELMLFPNAQHDDQVDNCSMACDTIAGSEISPEEHIKALKRRVALAASRQEIRQESKPVMPW
jgi:predicted phage terminase large subunit-like protein